ncbi:MAG: hypothetical protein J5982_05935 [Bacilli bacterium]|nr:hypothetical protein [Bacilli bacterium]
MENKKTLMNCEHGDTFALRIVSNQEYKDRYLIFIRFETDLYEDEKNSNDTSKLFRVKLTKNKELPKSFEELEELPYIICKITCYAKRYWPLDSDMEYKEIVEKYKNVKYYPDKYNYLYSYLLILSDYRCKRYVKNYVYLGNFSLTPPEKEYFPVDIFGNVFLLIDDLERYCLKSYHEHNLKKGKEYSEEAAKENNAYAEEEVKIQMELHNNIRKRNNKILITSISGWGTGLYDCDTALDMRDDYQRYLLEYDYKEVLILMKKQYKDFLNDREEKTIFWMVIADQEIKRKILIPEVKEKALKSIEDNLIIWKELDPKNYNIRKQKLYGLKKRINDFKNANIKRDF